MNFELRKLKSDDMFLMFGILSKVGIKELKESITPDSVKKLTEGGNGEDLSTFLGFNIMVDVANIVMKNLPYAKHEIYSFLSSVSGMTEKEISDLDMVTFTELVVAVVQKDEFKDFFKAVAKLFK